MTGAAKIDENVFRRLVLIRQMRDQSIVQSKRPHPQDVIAILLLHDAVELMAHLAAEFGQIGPQNQLMDYWKKLAQVHKPLGYRGPVERLNRIRVNLKHHGMLVSPEEIKRTIAEVNPFFSDTCQDIFQLEIESLDMTMLVKQSTASHALADASRLADSGDICGAIEHLDRGLSAMMTEHAEACGLAPTGVEFSVLPPQYNIRYPGLPSAFKTVEHLHNLTAKEARLIALGVDHRAWIKSRQITNQVSVAKLEWPADQTPAGPTRSDYAFFRRFLIQTALHFDAELAYLRLEHEDP